MYSFYFHVGSHISIAEQFTRLFDFCPIFMQVESYKKKTKKTPNKHNNDKKLKINEKSDQQNQNSFKMLGKRKLGGSHLNVLFFCFGFYKKKQKTRGFYDIQ